MAARFPCIMAVQMMGAVPVTTGSTVTVIYDSRTSIMDRIVILISRLNALGWWFIVCFHKEIFCEKCSEVGKGGDRGVT